MTTKTKNERSALFNRCVKEFRRDQTRTQWRLIAGSVPPEVDMTSAPTTRNPVFKKRPPQKPFCMGPACDDGDDEDDAEEEEYVDNDG
jgi:hypothetical protein